MRYPNTRYGDPNVMKYYAQGMSIKQLAKRLKRSEKSVKQWLSFEKKVPYYVPELLRLWNMEQEMIMRQMGFEKQDLKLGIVKGDVIQFTRERSRSNLTSARSTASSLPQPIGLQRDCS